MSGGGWGGLVRWELGYEERWVDYALGLLGPMESL